jgi:hypothetical protein
VQNGVVLTLHSDTWNPTLVTEENPRNEDLGVLLQSVDVMQGNEHFTVREALPIPRPPSDRRGLWLWYYDTPNHHLLDVWWWYVLVAGLPPGYVALLFGVIGLPALVAFSVGWRGVVAVLRGNMVSPGYMV